VEGSSYERGDHALFYFGRPSLITEDVKDSVDAHIRENMRFTVDELHEILPYISCSVFYESVTVTLGHTFV
jgi:hypothetical protein